jgi:deaminated glutathione amidase
MRISVIQMNSVNDKAGNLDQARSLVAEAVREDRPDLVVLPEVFAFMGGSLEERRRAADEVPGGEAYRMLRDMARTHGIFIHGGSFFEQAPEEEKLYNTTVAFDREGNELARYRKIHLFDVTTPDGREYKESAVVGSGRELVLYEADGVKVGCTICYDLRFGELYRGLAARGAQVIMVPAAFTLQTGKDHWEILLRARAIETQTYIAAAAQWGSYPAGNDVRHTYGHSMIVDPWGHIMTQAQDRTGFATARIDLGYLDKVRQAIPAQRHRVLEG